MRRAISRPPTPPSRSPPFVPRSSSTRAERHPSSRPEPLARSQHASRQVSAKQPLTGCSSRQCMTAAHGRNSSSSAPRSCLIAHFARVPRCGDELPCVTITPETTLARSRVRPPRAARAGSAHHAPSRAPTSHRPRSPNVPRARWVHMLSLMLFTSSPRNHGKQQSKDPAFATLTTWKQQDESHHPKGNNSHNDRARAHHLPSHMKTTAPA